MNADAGTGFSWRTELRDLLLFAIRCTVFTAILCAGIVLVMAGSRPALEKLKVELRKDKTHLRLTGLMTTNPHVHYRISLIEEESGRIRNAIDEIDLAIGLLELHRADKQVIERYVRRLEELKLKQADEPARKRGR